MNRAKSYRILIILLFFAFVSLLSRSLVYLVISITIAVLIVVLLSRDVKDRERRNDEKSLENRAGKGKGSYEKKDSGSPFSYVFPILFLASGALMASYGFTGYFEIEGIFHKLGWISREPFVQIVFFLVGIFLGLYGLTALLKKWLS
ncbi:hypothetical protein [Salipaludibacillus aurantiacus]|uniref:Uncharacterized protein n=1 Tax=Salipaludibacillus aurantiacus TaxID=1601833 RepID=A0A1H9P138_9BACI|nr:hypothetical protein [Salipaludibacillus aurantiacus]SER41900.1 hypothetical protein SAMN05518684_10199 [Salipaludibacillus aurantiacus]